MTATLERPGDHVTGLSDLAPRLVEEIILDTVRDTHRAIADRAFGFAPLSGLPRTIHDEVSGFVYAVMSAGARRTRRMLGLAASATAHTRAPQALERSAKWRKTIAILNGILGDALEEEGSPLALPMAVRVAGMDVPVDRESLAAAFPHARRRVAVLLHGLVESDDSWRFKAEVRGTTYPELLSSAGVTPVLVRYNTGRHVSDNAEDLAVLLEDVVDAWPVEVDELVLIGHSMGGLVARGAGELARSAGHGWVDRTRHLVMLGAPHLGAPLEKVANAGAWLLSAVPEAAAFGRVIRRRSAGIKDLRHGYLTALDWTDRDPDAWRSPPATHVDHLPDVDHHLIGATLGLTQSHPLSRTLGDLLVLWNSASAADQEWARVATVRHIAAADHFALLNHPDVAELLESIVTER